MSPYGRCYIAGHNEAHLAMLAELIFWVYMNSTSIVYVALVG